MAERLRRRVAARGGSDGGAILGSGRFGDGDEESGGCDAVQGAEEWLGNE